MVNTEKQKSWVLSIMIILIGGFMAILDSSIVNVAIPATLMIDFGVSHSKINIQVSYE